MPVLWTSATVSSGHRHWMVEMTMRVSLRPPAHESKVCIHQYVDLHYNSDPPSWRPAPSAACSWDRTGHLYNSWFSVSHRTFSVSLPLADLWSLFCSIAQTGLKFTK